MIATAAGALRRSALAWSVAAATLSLLGCGNSTPATQEAAQAPTPAPPAATGGVAPPSTAPQSAEPAAPRDHGDRRQRRERRHAERAERAFAAGPIAIAEAQRTEAHGRLVEFDGTVQKILTPDRRGRRHQRFVLTVPGAATVLVAHNTDLGGEVPLTVGDHVRVRGIFEFNRRGGVVHWTHHDPGGEAGAGWIRVGGKTYQ
jgi:hypothetical protein